MGSVPIWGRKRETCGETSIRQVVPHIARTIRGAGKKLGGYFATPPGCAFQAELSFLMVHQYGAFNSPVLIVAYGMSMGLRGGH
ncbi:hypothetical protein [Pajaroellobacter abortibovis]|uniref:Ribonucleotide reductase class II vitamin B12-dependent N-terminal domain-containing protein n=1 Tax=Pajaroellobacter abortibovis TaxID=1882918 RepID=A0A1L6MX81_9BACT|nr:hypothetical protein [Pajaroellobacter abortibovis]APS00059.1 hypothetical protein BCY86_04715 [Pajaroellobacter abortibovis]